MKNQKDPLKDTRRLLITVNLQDDYLLPVYPVPEYNVGKEEAVRLLGTDLKSGPIGNLVSWLSGIPHKDIFILHLKTVKSNAKDGTKPKLVLNLEDLVKDRKNQQTIEISSVNAFIHSGLEDFFQDCSDGRPCGLRDTKIGIVGVSCASTLTFLVYELWTRYGYRKLGTSTVLTGSKSRLQHTNSLNQLKNIFSVELFDSIIKFENWLYFLEDYKWDMSTSGQMTQNKVPTKKKILGNIKLDDIEMELVNYLYRGSSEYTVKPLSGGYSEAKVFRVKSKDWHGHEQAVTVLKMGSLKTISREKKNFENVASVLGTAAPSIMDYVELEEKAAIKFLFASMDQERETVNFMKVYMDETGKYGGQDQISRIIDITFKKVLGKFYRIAKRENANLFELYNFNGKGWNWRAGGTDTVHLVKERVEKLLKVDKNTNILDFFGIITAQNVSYFLENTLPEIKKTVAKVKNTSTLSFCHGDLNGRNILLDPNKNVWVIDFEYTQKDHVLKDPTKLEVDILFEYSHINNDDEMKEALRITRELTKVKDLGNELPESIAGVSSTKFVKAWKNVRHIRKIIAGILGTDRNALQLDIVMLRYTLWAMTWTHIPENNRVWALAAACGYAEKIENTITKNMKLYISKIPLNGMKGELGITILPGTRQSSLEADMAVLRGSNVFVLCTNLEMAWRYDRKRDLMDKAGFFNIKLFFYPLLDQSTPSITYCTETVSLISEMLVKGEDVVLVSFAGLGRCGTLASCVLVSLLKMTAEDAMELVKKHRSTRAIENVAQEKFVRRYEKYLKKAVTTQ